MWPVVVGRAAVVLASLYPALPTVLGLTPLHERVTSRQAIGLVGAAVAVVLLPLGRRAPAVTHGGRNGIINLGHSFS